MRSLLRVKSLQDEVQGQAAQLAAWNASSSSASPSSSAELERFGRLKRFFSPALAEAIVAGGEDTARSRTGARSASCSSTCAASPPSPSSAEPEEVMAVLHEYHAAMGRIVLAHDGTLERFAGDSVIGLLQRPAADRATRPNRRCAWRWRCSARSCRSASDWRKRGYDLELGSASRRATRRSARSASRAAGDYAAIGSVTNLAARLCGEAAGGQVLIDRKTMAKVEPLVETQPVGPLTLKGFAQPVSAFSVTRMVGAESD